MPMEKELLGKLAEAEKELTDAKRSLTDARRRWTEEETHVIEAKLNWDRIKEELRVYRNTTVRVELSENEKDIQGFRERHPELCAEAKARDIARQGKE